ncbi:MAG: hypothetical protein NE330_03980 [Lentisphaeraceae bacterium]|nr:hypothetical protein [Lentisphaeraceae bacterium]
MKTLFILVFFTSLLGAETFSPKDNPALLERSITGFTEPSAMVKVEAEYPARLNKFLVKEGTQLDGNSEKVLIATQNDTLAKIALKQMEAHLKSEESLLTKNKTEKETLNRILSFRLLELKRTKKLADTGRGTQSSYDSAKFEYDKASLGIKNIDASIIVQQAKITESKLKIEKAKEDISRFKLYGPKGWTLNKRIIEPGTMLKAGTAICELVDTRILSAFFRLDEQEVSYLRNNPIELYIKSTDKKIKATVHHIDLSFDKISRKQLVELRINSDQFKYISAGIELKLKTKVNYPSPATEIPFDFVYKRLEQYYVKVKSVGDVPVIPLRKNTSSIVVNLRSLPKDALLLKVNNK